MTISDGVVPSHALPKPDDLFQSQVLLQGRFNTLPAQVRVSAGMQQALLCTDEGPANSRQ